MKVIKYNLCDRINVGTEEAPVWEDRPGNVVEICCPPESLTSNEEIAKHEAYNGEYTILEEN